MKTNRRDFIRIAGITGTGMALSVPSHAGTATLKPEQKKHIQRFNMSGYAAPKIETVRAGIIGIGRRGIGFVHRLKLIEGVEIKAICDLRMECVEAGQKAITEFGLPAARTYGGSQDAWKEMCQSPDLDIIYVITPWNLHTPMAVYAMECGKHAAVEVPAAQSLDECWQLVETSERTRKHCMMLENCCYDIFELLTLNMTREGFFGELTHAEGAYIHAGDPKAKPKYEYADKWRIELEQNRYGNYYPTHGLGPICQCLNINRGDKFNFLVSMSCKDFVLGKKFAELAKTDDYFKRFDPNKQVGNTNTSMIMTQNGKTVMLQQGGATPRVYSRIHLLSGTKGSALKYPLPGKISDGIEWFSDAKMKEITDQYTPEIVKKVGEMALKVGGHGGADFIMDWRLIDCLRNGCPLDQDVYDAAVLSSMCPLTDWSVKNGSRPVDVPDFTCGSYVNNKPVDISLTGCGNTGVRQIKTEVKSKQLDV